MIQRVNLRELPPAARAIALTTQAAVDAAAAGDTAGLREAAAEQLSKLNTEQTGTVLGAVIRMLLEEQHPDGLDADDIRDVLESTTRSAASWLPEVDPHVLLVVLAGALGIHPEEHDEVPRPSDDDIALHSPVLIAGLLQARGRKLGPYLAVSLAEIARAETMEAP